MRAAPIIVAVVVAMGACGGHTPDPTPTSGSGSATQPAFHDTRTPIEQRRDAACDKLAARNTACAVEDAKHSLAAGKDPTGKPFTQAQFDHDTSPEYQAENNKRFAAKCKKQQLNSYQVRVYEVCMREESECDPMLACLQHINDPASQPAQPPASH
jgi:hypothetical protein